MLNLGFGKSTSNQESNSGFLQGPHKFGASSRAFDGLRVLSNDTQEQFQSPVPQFNMSSNIPGLFQEQEGAANAFANKMFANASAGGALRGQFSPNNTPGLIGSAITNMGATLFPMIAQNLQNAMLIPEQIRAQRVQNAMSPLQALIAGLGSSASGKSDAFNMSFGLGGGGGGGGATGGSSGSTSSGSAAGGAG